MEFTFLLLELTLFAIQEYGFFPNAYLLPNQYNQFERDMRLSSRRQVFIVKPNASSRGRGIRLADKLSQIDRQEECVVQKYVRFASSKN